MSGVALVALDSTVPEGLVELYDLGCLNHISPYCDCFENFETIVPRKFHAANQQTVQLALESWLWTYQMAMAIFAN